MFKRLNAFIVNNSILYNKQFGFRSPHSTIHDILSITDNIQRAIEVNTFSCGILTLTKARQCNRNLDWPKYRSTRNSVIQFNVKFIRESKGK